jgi:hypothetical protein
LSSASGKPVGAFELCLCSGRDSPQEMDVNMSSFHSTDGSARFSSDSGEGLGRYWVSPSPDVPGDVEMGSPSAWCGEGSDSNDESEGWDGESDCWDGGATAVVGQKPGGVGRCQLGADTSVGQAPRYRGKGRGRVADTPVRLAPGGGGRGRGRVADTPVRPAPGGGGRGRGRVADTPVRPAPGGGGRVADTPVRPAPGGGGRSRRKVVLGAATPVGAPGAGGGIGGAPRAGGRMGSVHPMHSF